MGQKRQIGKVPTAVIAAAFGIASAAGFAGCENNNPVATNRVVIRDSRYNPPVVKIRLGEQVTFKNEDNVDHTVTADNFETPNQLLPPGSEISFAPGHPLELLYHCEIHKFRGKLIAVPQDSEVPQP